MLTIPLPQKPKITTKEGHRAIFEIEGLYPGYGVTLGNALRRVILSSLPGAAITGVKIKGAQHEFSTIPFVAEDVIEIILNLKQIRLKSFSGEPVKLFLSAKGVKEVKASDIKATSEVEIMNKDLLIASLTDKRSELEMEIDVEPGVGFVPAEQRKKQKLEIGLIAVDAIFTPVRKVNFEVENMRVGDRTDYNKLIFDIETDGSVAPEEAFIKASQILVTQFGVFSAEEETAVETGNKEKKEEKSDSEVAIEEMKLSTRTLNALNKTEIKNAQDLSERSEDEISQIEGMGEKGIVEIKKALKKLGLGLKE